jgi:hypothetical protein
MAFGKRLNNDQVRIEHFGITISGKDKLQFYLNQMSASNHFDKKEMTEWEYKTIAIKDDFNEAKMYFDGLVKDYKVYAQNSGSTAGKHKFESANQAAKAHRGNKLRQYMDGIAQAVVAQEEQAANIRGSTKASSNAMAAQIKVMLDQIAQLTKTMANKENSTNCRGGGGGGGGSGGGLRERGQAQRDVVQYTKPCSMGCYCSSHVFHPAGKNHTRTMTLWQRGTTGKAAASTGHRPSASASSSRAMQLTQASQPQPTDWDQGRTIANKKRTIAKQ